MQPSFLGIQNMQLLEGNHFFKDYKVLGKLGAGNSAVYTIVNGKEEKALKEIQIKSDHEMDEVKKEIQLMKTLSQHSHPHIIQYYDSCILQRQGEFENIRIAYILLEKGITSLNRIVNSYHYQHLQVELQKRFFDIDTIKNFIKDMINVHSYLQKIKIAHCDIKPENILITDIQNMLIKICDIGCGKMINNDDTYTATISGTIPFLAPELLLNYSKSKINHNPFKSDVYSLGLCFIYFITFRKFTSLQRLMLPPDAFNDVIQDWIAYSISVSDKDPIVTSLLPKMLTFKQNDRMDFFELKNYFEKLDAPPKLITESILINHNHSSSTHELPQIKLMTMAPDSPLPSKVARKTSNFQIKMVKSNFFEQSPSKPFLVQNTSSPRKFSNKKISSPSRKSSVFSQFHQQQNNTPISSMRQLENSSQKFDLPGSPNKKKKPFHQKNGSLAQLRLAPIDMKSLNSTKSSFQDSPPKQNQNNQLNQKRYYFFDYKYMKEIKELVEQTNLIFNRDILVDGNNEELVSDLCQFPGTRNLGFIGSRNLRLLLESIGNLRQLQSLELNLDNYEFNGKECRKFQKTALKLINLSNVRITIENCTGAQKQFLESFVCCINFVKTLSIKVDFNEEFVWIQQFLKLNQLKIELNNVTMDDGQHKKILEYIKRMTELKDFKLRLIRCTLQNLKSSSWGVSNDLRKLELNYDSTNIPYSSLILSVVNLSEIECFQMDISNMQNQKSSLIKLLVQNIGKLQKLRELKLVLNYISNFDIQTQIMLWDKIKELRKLEQVEVQQKGVETDQLVIERFLEQSDMNLIEQSLVCNRVASRKQIHEMNENANVVSVDVEWIAIRLVQRRSVEYYEGWMECIDCNCKIQGDCVYNCHENHRICMTDYFGQVGIVESEQQSDCCVHKRPYCNKIFQKSIEGFPKKCITCDRDYLCSYCIDNFHSDHSILTHYFKTKFLCGSW